jgi:hypothetical protein
MPEITAIEIKKHITVPAAPFFVFLAVYSNDMVGTDPHQASMAYKGLERFQPIMRPIL